jgi:hypothetical protein
MEFNLCLFSALCTMLLGWLPLRFLNSSGLLAIDLVNSVYILSTGS